MEGYGEYTFYGGNDYVGDFKEDKFEGIGILEFSFGDVYKGEFSKDRMCGVPGNARILRPAQVHGEPI